MIVFLRKRVELFLKIKPRLDSSGQSFGGSTRSTCLQAPFTLADQEPGSAGWCAKSHKVTVLDDVQPSGCRYCCLHGAIALFTIFELVCPGRMIYKNTFKREGLTVEAKLLTHPRVYHDERGFFNELYNLERDDIPGMQAIRNVGRTQSDKGVIRGIHYQLPRQMGKLVCCTKGFIWDVVVDIRPDSLTYRQWQPYLLSADNGRRLWVPRGYGHGYLAMADQTEVLYMCDEAFYPEDSLAIHYADPGIGINWPTIGVDYILSPQDAQAVTLDDACRLGKLPLQGANSAKNRAAQ